MIQMVRPIVLMWVVMFGVITLDAQNDEFYFQRLYSKALVHQMNSEFNESKSYYEAMLKDSSKVMGTFQLFNAYAVAKELKDEKFQAVVIKELIVHHPYRKDAFKKEVHKHHDSLVNIYEENIADTVQTVFKEQLSRLFEREQKLRFNLKEASQLNPDTLRIMDSTNCVMFLDLYDKYGFPTEEITGESFDKLCGTLIHHFMYYEDLFLKMKPVLLQAYMDNQLDQSFISYYFDLHCERVYRCYHLGNLAARVYQGNLKEPYFVQDSIQLAFINENREKFALIPYQYHQKAVLEVYGKGFFDSIWKLLTLPKHYLYTGNWSFIWGFSDELMKSIEMNHGKEIDYLYL